MNYNHGLEFVGIFLGIISVGTGLMFLVGALMAGIIPWWAKIFLVCVVVFIIGSLL